MERWDKQGVLELVEIIIIDLHYVWCIAWAAGCYRGLDWFQFIAYAQLFEWSDYLSKIIYL